MTRSPRRIEDVRVGERASVRRTFAEQDVRQFAELSGDFNELHVDEDAGARSRFGSRVVHGALTASLFSRLIGMELPGRGAIYMSQTLRFTAPVRIGDEVEAEVIVAAIDLDRKRITLETRCHLTANGSTVLTGEALVLLDT